MAKTSSKPDGEIKPGAVRVIPPSKPTEDLPPVVQTPLEADQSEHEPLKIEVLHMKEQRIVKLEDEVKRLTEALKQPEKERADVAKLPVVFRTKSPDLYAQQAVSEIEAAIEIRSCKASVTLEDSRVVVNIDLY